MTSDIPNQEADKAGVDEGPVYFWRASEEPYGVFGQWHMGKITVTAESLNYLKRKGKSFPEQTAEVTFNCAEQYMMYAKALYFNDADSAKDILRAKPPGKQKGIGRKVKGFNDDDWSKIRERVVVESNWIKFHDPKLKEILLSTGDRELMEASPFDRVWGIGFKAEDAHLHSRNSYGLNLLGKALMTVRERLRQS
jgi:ribA/ribD-fused uncharacterized protein